MCACVARLASRGCWVQAAAWAPAAAVGMVEQEEGEERDEEERGCWVQQVQTVA